MVITPMWAEQMTAGRGWIALALVVFSGWRAGSAARRRLLLRHPDDARALRQGLRLLVPAVPVLGFDALHHGRNRARFHVGARRHRKRGPGLSRPALPSQHLGARAMSLKEKKMSTITDAISSRPPPPAWRCPPSDEAPSPRAAQDRLHLSRPGRRLRLDLGARQGPQGDARGAERPGDRRLRREREGGRERHSDHQGPRPAGPQAHLRHLVRLHGPDASKSPSSSRTSSSSIAPATSAPTTSAPTTPASIRAARSRARSPA
jgi:hypothetical protein